MNSVRTVVAVRKDGNYLPVELSISRISKDRIAGIFRKISLIDILYDGIIGVYLDKIIMANKIVCNIFDCKMNDMIGNQVTSYFTKKQIEDSTIDIVSNNINKTFKLSKLKVDKQVYFILITEMKEINTIRQEKQLVENLNKELSEKVVEIEKLVRVKTDFLANMSHEIRTPMNGIYGMLSLLKDTSLNTVQLNYLDVCRRSAESLMAVLDDILLISKSGAGNIELENISFNLSELIEDVVDISSHSVDDSKNIDLVYYIDPNISQNIIGDPTRLRQILTNLMNNAVKFTHLGEVALEVMIEKNDPFTLKFEISDTGIGMTSEELEKIFKPFSQADSSTTRNYGGTGLGLVICKQLVELFNGKMVVNSRAGRGSNFSFTIETKPDKYIINDKTDNEILKNKKILVVDDNAVNCLLMEQILKNYECNVKSVRSGFKAIDEIQLFEIVILDYHMPSLNGIEVANILKNKKYTQHFEILMISSYNAMSEAMAETSIKYYMNKPVKKKILINTLENIINTQIEKTNLINELTNERQIINNKDVKNEYIPITNNKDVENEYTSVKNNSLLCLIVEDNLINQQVLSLLLKKMNFEILIANNGLEALEILENTKNITIIMMDIHMPRMDGIKATKIIRNKGITIPIIAITADISFSKNRDYIETGFTGCLTKPVFEKNLVNKLNTVLKIDL